MPPASLTAPPLLPLKPFTCRLPQRSLLRVRGRDAHEFLQGLYTNDATLLRPGGSQWGCFLYVPGRVMCDAYVYQARQVYEGQSSLLIDVHRDVKEVLLDHLVEMKMRKKVKIEDVSDSLAVAAMLERSEAAAAVASSAADASEEAPADSADGSTLSETLAETFLDPRCFALFPAPSPAAAGEAATGTSPGWQLRKKVVPVAWSPSVQPSFPDGTPSIQASGTTDSVNANARAACDAFFDDPYKTLLLANGIGEGPKLFRDGKTLPFELNTDFLDGVHFNKGCYIGQELTHRTHVMLVTRKRTVPIFFPVRDAAAGEAGVKGPRDFVGEGLYINGGKEKVGEVTASSGPYGLGLLRLRYVDKETRTMPGLTLKDGQPVLMHFPAWWPPKQIKKLLKNN